MSGTSDTPEIERMRMEIKTSLFKRKSGRTNGFAPKTYGKGKWFMRIKYFDESAGKVRSIERQFDSKRDAEDYRNKRIDELRGNNKKSLEGFRSGERMTFNQLADECEASIFRPAEIDGTGYKIAGIRSHEKVKSFLKQLRSYFGDRKLRGITEIDLVNYRLSRLKPADTSIRSVSHTTANRELAHMSTAWHYALRRGYVTHNPFADRQTIILKGREVERSRILSREEENRLLAACEGFYVSKYVRVLRGKERPTEATITRRNPQLRALIILAIDSGCRLGELLKLRWKDLDFARNSIRVIGSHTKTERERYAFLTERAKAELNAIQPAKANIDDDVFPFKSVKRSFKKALSIAGIEGFHFHDLRRTGVSRWQASGVPLAMAQKLAGHNDSKMTARVYTTTSDEMHVQFVENLNAYYAHVATPAESSREFVN